MIAVDMNRALQTPKINYRSIIASPLLLALVFVSPPLFFIERYSLASINKPIIFTIIIALAILLLQRFTINKTTAQLGLLQIVQASLLLVLPFLHLTFGYGLDIGYFNLAFQILTGLALFFVFANNGQIGLLARFWVNIHLVIGACGLLVFMAGILFDFQPLTTFSDRPYYDFGLSYTNIFYQIGRVNLIRIAGFYDEPGTFAFYMTFALLIARIFRMAKWKEILLIVFGLTSLSIAFMVVVFFWFLFAGMRKHVPYVLVLAVGLLFALGRADVEVQDLVYRVTLDRFSMSSPQGRLLRGDNRTPIMIENYEAFSDAPVIGHGLHYDDYVGDNYGFSFIVNPMAPFATHGVIGAFIVNLHVLVLFVVLIATKSLIKRDKVLVFLVLLATLAQRPITINGLGYLLFIVMIYGLLTNRPSAASSTDFS